MASASPPSKTYNYVRSGGYTNTSTSIRAGGYTNTVEHVSVSESSGSGTLVAPLLFFLIIANGFTSGQFQGLWETIVKGSQAGITPQQVHQYVLVVGGELAFLVVLSMIAQSSDSAGRVTMIFVLTLWAVYLFHNKAKFTSYLKKTKAS